MSALPDRDLTRDFAATRTTLQAALHALDAARGKAADGRYGDAVLAIGSTMLTRLDDAGARVNDLVDRLEALGGLERFPG
ncbi:MAG TPA: hypothetical protein VL422_10120 [Miltoncostaea sp.]|nr:hypothetical protein [Miltoncostaea sp.]